MPPAGGPDGASVQTGGLGSKLALLQQGHFVTVLGEVAGGRGARDPATDDEYVGLVHVLPCCYEDIFLVISSCIPSVRTWARRRARFTAATADLSVPSLWRLCGLRSLPPRDRCAPWRLGGSRSRLHRRDG